ncbi:MAG: PfkB family carbohydrate kinase [Alphaproteobacteria bacterium]
MSAPHLIAVGAICDTTIYRVPAVPSLPAKALADQVARVVDGMAVSAACAFVKMGGTASAWGRLGDDPLGYSMQRALGDAGLDVKALRLVPGGSSSTAAVIVDHAGDRLVVPYHDPSLDPDPGFLPLGDIARADFIHCDMRWPEGAEAAMRAARKAGKRVMLDADVGPRAILERLVPLATHAVFSDAGLLAFTGASDVSEGLKAVAATHTGHVGASCGAQGYLWWEEGAVRHVPAPEVAVIDTLAAGDVFHGALAYALAEGRPMVDAARFACVAASIKCTRFGGRLGCPSRAEVDALLAGFSG